MMLLFYHYSILKQMAILLSLSPGLSIVADEDSHLFFNPIQVIRSRPFWYL